MQFTTLGRTGLRVSVAGLGCGGHSRLGQSYGNTTAESVAVVSAALDAGINFIDTAAAYRTEQIVGEALGGRRESVVISTKSGVQKQDPETGEMRPITPAELNKRLDDSLSRLRTDYVDVYNLHGVVASELDYAHNELLPVLQAQQQQGKIRFLGITERFIADTGHAMLQQALQSDVWDVVMVGFNLLNPSARERVLNRTQAQNVGVQDMFAVRRALSDPEALVEEIQIAVATGQVDADAVDLKDPLGSILEQSGAASVVELAYRFCRHEPGVQVVLTGTGKIEHLLHNVDAINGPPLPDQTQCDLADLFGRVDCLSGN